jgi:accessory gene regulator B
VASLEEFIKEHKKYDDLQAKKAAYQLKIFLRSMLYTVLILFIFYFLGIFTEGLILYIFYKLYRENAGGIHIKNYIICFIFSFLLLLITVLLTKFIVLSIYLEILIYSYILLIWFKLVPQGTSQRPIRRVEEKRKMKFKMFVLILVTFSLRFIYFDIYKLGLWSLVLTLTMILPLVYKLFHVKHDRI